MSNSVILEKLDNIKNQIEELKGSIDEIKADVKLNTAARNQQKIINTILGVVGGSAFTASMTLIIKILV